MQVTRFVQENISDNYLMFVRYIFVFANLIPLSYKFAFSSLSKRYILTSTTNYKKIKMTMVTGKSINVSIILPK